jgi:DNA-binding CsgD family transcriptional regulator
VLNRSRRGFILLDRTLSLLFANSHATAAFAAGGSIRLRSRRPTPRNRADARRFREALEFALGFPERQSVVTLRGLEDEVDLVATVGGLACPKAPIDLGARPAAVVVRLSSALPRTTLLAPGYLEAIFTFTPKEAQVANLLVAGLELPEISTRLAIAYGTTRQHLKAIFVKTGLHRQRDLVHLLRMSLPPDSGVTSAA